MTRLPYKSLSLCLYIMYKGHSTRPLFDIATYSVTTFYFIFLYERDNNRIVEEIKEIYM